VTPAVSWAVALQGVASLCYSTFYLRNSMKLVFTARQIFSTPQEQILLKYATNMSRIFLGSADAFRLFSLCKCSR